MKISDILSPNRVDCGARAGSKKRAIELLSRLIVSDAPAHLTPTAVFDRLFARERLGSTGLGAGVALPHGRFPNLDRTICAFLRLPEPVEFDTRDGQPVDLLMGLLVPEECTDEHLRILPVLTERFGDASFLARLRAPETSPDRLYALLTGMTDGGGSPSPPETASEGLPSW